MARSSSPEDSQVLIARQLNTLHLKELRKGGESIRASVENHSDQEDATHSTVEVIRIKEEDLSEEETATPENPAIPVYEGDMIGTARNDVRARFRSQLEDDDFMVIDEINVEEARAQLQRDMEAERKRFTGASNWAPAEERLFELLYMREQLAMMPRHWGYDFQGVPFQDHVFSTSESNPPVIFAHSRKTEFQATRGMMKLVDLSSKVRTLLQSGFEAKAPILIEKELNDFVSWAAADGGYHKLEVIPNLAVEVVKTDSDHGTVIKSRMDALAQLHRDFLRADRANYGWLGVKNEVLEQGFNLVGSSPRSVGSKRRMSVAHSSLEDRAAVAAVTSCSSTASNTPASKRKHSPDDGMAAPNRPSKRRLDTINPSRTPLPRFQTPHTPPSSRQQRFTRRPPVVWGLFIINTSVFLCTLDSSKEGEDAYVSWHAEIAFTQTRQCVWHALTIALVVCLARDELMTRLDDFEQLPEESDEDPDL